MPLYKKKDFIKTRKKRKGLYQSDQVPEHFQNEGGEYIERSPNREDIQEDTKENASFDKIKGNTPTNNNE